MTDTARCDLRIDNVTFLDGSTGGVAITGNRITALGDGLPATAGETIDGTGMLAMPGLVNNHTHGAMTLMRGFGDDMPLKAWLEERVWPAEAKLTADACYWGTRLAALEMVRTGTTFFSDMYWHVPDCARAIRDSGIRARVAAIFVKFLPGDQRAQATDLHRRWASGEWGDRISFCLGPHAPYTVEPDELEWIGGFASEHDVPVHIHLSENAWEVADIEKAHGCRPVMLMDRLGVLGPRFMGAHCVWLDADEFALMAERGATCIHNPCANMKLGVGGAETRTFDYRTAKAAGTRVVLGTDGPCSNNSLDMLEEMKFAALLAKHATGDPTVMPAPEAIALATSAAGEAQDLDIGRLQPGALADLILLRLDDVTLTPRWDLQSHVVYAANGAVVDTTVCDGKVLMRGGIVDGLDEVTAKAEEAIAAMGWRDM